MKKWFLILCLFPFITEAQDSLRIKKTNSGILSFGQRTVFSTFTNGDTKTVGMGIGGQFRLFISDKVNSEWFADYITSDLQGLGHRTDYHIGWSVMFYPQKERPDFKKLMTPYIVAGHCFDNTVIAANGPNQKQYERFSSAIQAGLGNHFNITRRFDISVCAQYMIHLGSDLETKVVDNHLEVKKTQGPNLEGHLLISVTANYKIADLW